MVEGFSNHKMLLLLGQCITTCLNQQPNQKDYTPQSMSLRHDVRETTRVERYCATLWKQVEANREQTLRAAAAAEMICMILHDDRERANKMAVVMAKLQQKIKSKNIALLDNRRKLSTRMEYSGKWESGM